MALNFKERVADNGTEQPGGAGFSIDSAKAVGYYYLDQGSAGSITLQDIQNSITQIVGTTNYDVGDGRLQRTPPLAHPMFPWLFAKNISKQWGTGNWSTTNAAGGLDVPPLPQFALYSQYFFQVEFGQYPFPVVSDANITLPNGSYYDDTGTQQTFKYATEYNRFTDYTIQPATSSDNNITQTGGTLGRMVFQTAGNVSPGTKGFDGTQQLQVPNSFIKVVHYGVPYRWVTSAKSYYFRWLNRVNQNKVTLLDFTANPGELLYLGMTPTKYTPPVQQSEQFGPGVFASQKNCNVELTFLFTRRTGTLLPSAPANGNYVMGGHNLLPDFNSRKFYYATTAAGTPSYLSCPVEILFSDPDAAGGVA